MICVLLPDPPRGRSSHSLLGLHLVREEFCHGTKCGPTSLTEEGIIQENLSWVLTQVQEDPSYYLKPTNERKLLKNRNKKPTKNPQFARSP